MAKKKSIFFFAELDCRHFSPGDHEGRLRVWGQFPCFDTEPEIKVHSLFNYVLHPLPHEYFKKKTAQINTLSLRF